MGSASEAFGPGNYLKHDWIKAKGTSLKLLSKWKCTARIDHIMNPRQEHAEPNQSSEIRPIMKDKEM